MDKNDKIFKIKPIGNTNIVVEDKRKTISPFNSAKHFKEANIPPKYEKGAVCGIRKDFISFINELDTRNPEDLKGMIDMVAKLTFENVLMTLTQAKFDGNVPDRNSKSEINTLLNIVKSMNDLNSKITITEKKEFSKEGDISSIFRQIKAQKKDG